MGHKSTEIPLEVVELVDGFMLCHSALVGTRMFKQMHQETVRQYGLTFTLYYKFLDVRDQYHDLLTRQVQGNYRRLKQGENLIIRLEVKEAF
jgi:hypothetical protein